MSIPEDDWMLGPGDDDYERDPIYFDVVVDVLIDGHDRPVRVVMCNPGEWPEIRADIAGTGTWSDVRAGVWLIALRAEPN